MEVDDEYEWMEEAGYKPVDSRKKDWGPQSISGPSIALKP